MTAATRPELRVTRGGDADGPVVITGGAGFIGTNLAGRLLARGEAVTVLDNLSRPGVDRNVRGLKDRFGTLLRVEIGDVRDAATVTRVVNGARRVVHLAAQVAVTTSLQDPLRDFEVNALGTLNVLNALRTSAAPAPLLFTSTNKVYGNLDDVPMVRNGRRYEPADTLLANRGIDESRRLDLHSPYGCSKGAADQYVLDFARSYGLPTTVFRMSCIYGPHQFGTEDQGWVAHFMIQALAGRDVTLFGDGCQVRDILYVDDLLDAVDATFDNMDAVAGCAFNIGGGPDSATSLLEVLDHIGVAIGSPPGVQAGPWRTGDQKYYVSDITRFSTLTGWRPRTGVVDGLAALRTWLQHAGLPSAPDSAGRPEPAPLAAGAGGPER
ncbi:MAG TPA: NAD-dependent epimerase/dehydratase family protein [Longimicrobiales bacterium]|nr:NAD-dependent epimerase/dehydratase family protein [Longimicrobiales bacterium]